MNHVKIKTVTESSGFTLIEILIAMVILATVLSTVFASYAGTFRIVKETEDRAEAYRMARIALERMIEDLESFCRPVKRTSEEAEETDDSEKPFEFVGEDKEIEGREADGLRFLSRAHIDLGGQDRSWGTSEISYYVEEAEEGEGFVLYRKESLPLQESSEENSGGVPLCVNLSYVSFTFRDAEGETVESWDEPTDEDAEPIPKLVSVSLGFVNPADPEAPIKFTTQVALPAGAAGKKQT